MVKLDDDFYTRDDVTQIAKELLGKTLVTCFDGKLTSAMITETEAYAGFTDRASHAYGGRRTARTEIMYRRGGVAYVYLCYGIHHLFNVVTGMADVPHAVLIRAAEPLEGIDTMLVRRGHQILTPTLTSGPGAISAALGIHYSQTGISLSGQEVWIEDRGIIISPYEMAVATRVGVAYAQQDALLPYRFFIKDNLYISKDKGVKNTNSPRKVG